MISSQNKKHILVIRFSAMGDVAMAVPVLKQLLAQHPDVHITFLSQQKFEPIFAHIERLQFYSADIYGKHKGFFGLYRLCKTLRRLHNFDYIADLHHVLRSKIIRNFFKLSGYTVRYIDKGRAAKKALTQKENKQLIPLQSTFERYADIFRSLGFAVQLTKNIQRTKLPLKNIVQHVAFPFPPQKEDKKELIIAIAPFAQYKEKTYPIEKMKELLKIVTSKGYHILLFGGREEIQILQAWEKEYNYTTCVAGKFTLEDELALISNVDVMISMDSANMHLASLYGVPVISIWGATHPYAGFYGYGQNIHNAIQADIYCRPCSVFGNKPCYRGNWACMYAITPAMIVEKAISVVMG